MTAKQRIEAMMVDVRATIVGELDRASITQRELARRLGVTEARVSQLLGRRGNPTIRSLARIADAVGRRLVIAFEAGDRDPWAWAVRDETGSIPSEFGGCCDYEVHLFEDEAQRAADDHRVRLWDSGQYGTDADAIDALVTVVPLYPKCEAP